MEIRKRHKNLLFLQFETRIVLIRLIRPISLISLIGTIRDSDFE